MGFQSNITKFWKYHRISWLLGNSNCQTRPMSHQDRRAIFWCLITTIQKTSTMTHYGKALAQEDGLLSKGRPYPTVQEGLVTEAGAQECTDCICQCYMTQHSGSLELVPGSSAIGLDRTTGGYFLGIHWAARVYHDPNPNFSTP